MKEVKAIIQPFMLDAVLDALHTIKGLPGITLSEARAVNMEPGRYEQIVKVKLEIMVTDGNGGDRDSGNSEGGTHRQNRMSSRLSLTPARAYTFARCQQVKKERV